MSATYNAAVYARQPHRGREIALLLTAPSRPAETRFFGHMMLAELDLAVGRTDRARSHLKRLGELDPNAATPIEALLLEAPAVRRSRDRLEPIAARLRRTPYTMTTAPFASGWRPEERSPGLASLYALGRLSALIGDRAELDRVVQSLTAAAPDSLLAASLASDLQLLREPAGDPRRTTSTDLALRVPAEVAVLSPVFSRPARRFQHAQALEAEGRLREALVWYEGLSTYSVHDLPWGVPALLDRARILDQLGEGTAAAELRQRFRDLWEGPPPLEVRP